MSKLKVTTISDPDNDNTALTIDSSGNVTASQNTTLSGDVTVSGGFIPSTQLSHRNLIINGAMQVAQRGTSFTSHTSGYTLDRMKVYRTGNQDFTVTQESDAPTGSGFQKSIKIQTTTADATLDSGDYSILQYNIEGQDLQQLAYGSSGAKSKTLSFWVKSNMTGNLSVTSEVNVGPPYLSGYVTINTADTWEYKTITYVGNTATAIDNDNTTGIELQFWLSAGSVFSGSTYNNTSWNTVNGARVNSTNQINIQNSTSNYIQFTGVQLEVGSVATPFEHRSYGEELARCQRYYFKPDHPSNDLQLYAIAGTSFNVASRWHYNYPTTMRSDPTVSATFNNAIATGINSGKDSTRFYCQASGGTPYITPGTIIFDAEL